MNMLYSSTRLIKLRNNLHTTNLIYLHTRSTVLYSSKTTPEKLKPVKPELDFTPNLQSMYDLNRHANQNQNQYNIVSIMSSANN